MITKNYIKYPDSLWQIRLHFKYELRWVCYYTISVSIFNMVFYNHQFQ